MNPKLKPTRSQQPRQSKRRFDIPDIQSTPPHSVEAEQGVLGSMLIAPHETITECVEKINEQYFYIPAHQTIYTALVDLWDSGQAVDLITFTQSLRDKNLLENVGGAAFVTSLFTFVPTAANVGYYLDIVRDKYVLRQIILSGTESVRRAHEEQDNPAAILCEAETRLSTLWHGHGRNGQFPPIEDAADFLGREIVTPRDVVDGLLHRGSKMVIGGGSKSFKTWQQVDLAVSVVTGADWLGRITNKGRVLYVNLELEAAFFRQRVQTVSQAKRTDIDPQLLHVWNLRGHASDLSLLVTPIAQKAGRDKYDLIILDPIYKVLGTRDENKAGDVATLLNEIDRLAVASGAAVVFGAHFSKGNQAGKESIDRIGGSGVFARDPDSILIFTRHEEQDAFTVEATLRNHPPISPFVVRWEFPLMRVDDGLDPSRLKQAGTFPTQYRSGELAQLITRPMSATELKTAANEEYGMSERTFYRLFGELKASGAIRADLNRKWERA